MRKEIAFQIILPQDFDEFFWEYRAKGWIPEVIIDLDGKIEKIEVYDFVRFSQDIEDEVLNVNYLFYKNLLLVKEITKESILEAISEYIQQNLSS